MKPHLWKLALIAAGLIWVAILVQPNIFGSTTASSDSTQTSQQPVSQPPAASTPERSTTTASQGPATPTLQPPAPTAITAPTSAPKFHTVQQGGEFPGAIAAEYGITAEALMAANQITDPTNLQIGQQLLTPITATPIAQPSSASRRNASPSPMPTPVFHSVPRVNPASNPTLPRITSPAPSPPELVTLEQEMIEAVNVQRQAYGLTPLAFDEQLSTVARAHAQDMATRGYLSHVTPEGMTLRDRLQEHGLATNWAGENIQRNTRAANETAQYAVEWFMDSAPHRNNILHNRFNRIGVGVAEEPPAWFTFVLVFAGE